MKENSRIAHAAIVLRVDHGPPDPYVLFEGTLELMVIRVLSDTEWAAVGGAVAASAGNMDLLGPG